MVAYFSNNSQQKMPKNAEIFYCEKCDFSANKLSNYNKHILTRKHQKNINGNTLATFSQQKKMPKCECGKSFQTRSGLWRHQQKCPKNIDTIEKNAEKNAELCSQEPDGEEKDALLLLVQQNKDFKEMLLEQNKTILNMCKDMSSKVVNTTHTNSHNKSFNLNFFLNEQCKDAMNIMDFVNSVKLQINDLEEVGENGYVEGLSNIILRNLKALDVYKRPIHSSDPKRDILYIKDEDKWEKETEDHPRFKKAIKHIAHKNSKLLFDYKEKFPDCVQPNSSKNNDYSKLVIAAYDGTDDNENRIIKKVSKELTIIKDLNENN